MAEKKNRVDATSSAYDFMLPRWQKMDALLGGSEAMREHPELLVQFSHESNENFNQRLASATLFNVTGLTLDAWVGRPFGDPIVYHNDFDPDILKLTENIDQQGNNFDVFAREWFRTGLAKSLSHVLVDMPRTRRVDADGNQVPRTLADDIREGVRPYLVHLPPEAVFFATSSVVNGAEQLTEVRYWSERQIQDNFLESYVPQVVRLLPGVRQVWELADPTEKNDEKWEWFIVDEYTYDLPFIPLVTFYSNRTGFMTGKPPLTDLADLNITHWNSESEQRNILSVARFPILAATGVVSKKGLVIGPKKLLQSEDKDSKFFYVEHTGAAINAGFKDIAELEARMAQWGSQFLIQRPGHTTATSRAMDSAESISPLQDVTNRFMDSANLALQYMSQWMDRDTESVTNTIKLSTDFGPEHLEQGDIQILMDARLSGDMSREQFIHELMRRGILADDFDVTKPVPTRAGETTADPRTRADRKNN